MLVLTLYISPHKHSAMNQTVRRAKKFNDAPLHNNKRKQIDVQGSSSNKKQRDVRAKNQIGARASCSSSNKKQRDVHAKNQIDVRASCSSSSKKQRDEHAKKQRDALVTCSSNNSSRKTSVVRARMPSAKQRRYKWCVHVLCICVNYLAP